MAQKIYYQWQDDDATFDFNINQLLVSSPPGRYCGYDFGETLVSTLPFSGGLILGSHATGKDFPTKDDVTTRSPKLSVCRTQQGETITEAEKVQITIDANSSGFPRIDTIVVEHEYVDGLVGGSVAYYSAIVGTPNANPIAPAVIDTERQTIIGTLYIPDGLGVSISDIQSSDWTPANVPNFANDATIPHTNTENSFSELQVMKGIATLPNTIALTTITAGSEYALDFGESGANGIGNSFVVWGVTSGSVPSDYAPVFGVAPEYKINVVRLVNIYPTFGLRFVSTLNGGAFLTPNNEDVYVNAGTPIIIQKGCVLGTWEVVVGGQSLTNVPTKHRKTLSTSFEHIGVDSGSIYLQSKGNQVYIVDTSFQEIEFISSTDYTLDAIEEGTQITIHANDSYGFKMITQLSVSAGQSAPASGYKRVWNPLGYDVSVCAGGSVTLVETKTHWKIISISGEIPTWYELQSGTIDVSGRYVARIANRIFFKDSIQIHANGGGVVAQNCGLTLFSLPSIQKYPTNEYTFGLNGSDDRMVHFRWGTSASNYTFKNAIFQGSIGFTLIFNSPISGGDNVWLLTDGINLLAAN